MSSEERTQALLESLAEAGLVPGTAVELIPAAFRPTTGLDVSFGDKAVNIGNLFRAAECRSPPLVSFQAESEAPSNASYTLILTDGDAPTPEDRRFAWWRHWVVCGLQPNAPGGGRVLTEYLGPGPKDDSNPHRYLFLLFREPEGLVLNKEDVGGEEFVQRRCFKPAQFAALSGLRLVGVNWMTCVGDGWKS